MNQKSFRAALLAVLIAVVGLSLFNVTRRVDSAPDFNENAVVSAVNQVRQQRGAPTLTQNELLSAAAAAKAADMLDHDYWAHQQAGGPDPWQFIAKQNYVYASAGENLARGFTSPDEIVSAWYFSLAHRQNLLNPDFREIGVAHVRGELAGRQTTLTVAIFAAPAAVALSLNEPAVAEPRPEVLAVGTEAAQQSALGSLSRVFAPLSNLARVLILGLVMMNLLHLLLELKKGPISRSWHVWLLLLGSAAAIVGLLISTAQAVL